MQQPFAIQINGGRHHRLRSEAQVNAALLALEARRSGIFVISKASGAYARCTGQHGRYVVESRDGLYGDDQTFRHFVAGIDRVRGPIVWVPTGRYAFVSVFANECLTEPQARHVLIAYMRTGRRATDYCWRDTTASFTWHARETATQVVDAPVTLYEYGRGIAGRRAAGQALPQIYRGSGRWRDFDDLENWAENSMEISRAEFDWLIKAWDRE